MQRLASFLLTALVFAAAWGIYSKHRVRTPAAPTVTFTPQVESTKFQRDTSEGHESQFRCDGRTYCSQMTSCAEAKYFLEHCPNVKMDGDHDGVPCERQWCTGTSRGLTIVGGYRYIPRKEKNNQQTSTSLTQLLGWNVCLRL